jgi:hypothetical protein
MKISFFKRMRGPDGEPVKMFDLIRIANKVRGWSLSWHPRNPSCKVGFYNNRSRCGLVGCLNLPVIGDFSLWCSNGWRARP